MESFSMRFSRLVSYKADGMASYFSLDIRVDWQS